MTQNSKKLAIAIALALAGVPAFADGTLQQAVEKSILNNPEVVTRYHTLRASEEEQGASRGNWLPKLNAQAYGGGESQSYPPGGGGSGGSWYSHPGASIALRQLIFDGLATSNDVKRLGFAKLARYYELLGASDDIALAASQAYIDVQRYRRLVDLARDNWATHKEVFGQIEDRTKAGVGRRADLEQAAGRLALAQSNWLTEAQNLHDVIQRYKRIVGEVPPEALAEIPAVDARLPKERNPLPVIVAANPNFRATVAGLRSARYETETRRASNLPSLELQASQAWDRNRDNLTGNYNDSQVRVVMNYNIFNGGSDQARIRQARELYYAAVDQRDKTCRDVSQTAAVALNDVKILTQQQQYLDQHALSTSKVRDAYRQQFDIGQRTLLDLLDTENELFSARRAASVGLYDLQFAKYRVLAAAHDLLPALQLAPLAKNAPEEDGHDGGPPEDSAADCANNLYIAPDLDPDAAMASRPAPLPTRPPMPAATPAIAPVPATAAKAAPTAKSASTSKTTPAVSLKAQTDKLFAYGGAKVQPSAATELDKFAEKASHYDIEKVKVTGHTDRIGTGAVNQRLSEQRASAVRDYLIGKGMDAGKFSVEGKGATLPISKCDKQDDETHLNTKLIECLKPDRRVEIEMTGTLTKR